MEQYSTLEVRQVENYNFYDSDESNKEAVNHPTSLYPQRIPFENDGSGEYGPEVINHAGRQQQAQNNPPELEEEPTKRIWGLPRRRFYAILIVVLLVVIGAIAGGVAGGLTSKRHDTSKQADNPGDSPNSTSEPPNSNLLSISKLAASNRTDSNGYAHRTVFFQDPYNNIIARRWESQNRTWVTSNVTYVMAGSTTPLNPLPGTSLASASCTWNNSVNEVHLWFTVPDNYVSGTRLSNPDTEQDDWEYDSMSSAALETSPGSQLAAAWQRCWKDDCIGDWLVAYQTPQGGINVANATDWGSPTEVVARREVADNSSLGLMPQLKAGTIGVNRVVLVSESLSSTTTGTMQKSMYEDEWASDGSLIDGLPAPTSTLQFAITLMNNFTETMFLSLLPDGTVKAKWWGGHFTDIPSINFRGGPLVNFTAIAASEDAMFYGISNDEVLQYQPDDTDLFSFVYVGKVYP